MSKTYHIDSESPNAEVINLAATVLRDGGLVVFPTETVYGIGALADSKFGAQEIFEVKVRPLDKPLPWLVENEDALDTYGVDIPEYAHRLAHAYWPGPLTLVVKASERVGRDFRAPDGTVALRSPGPRGRHRAHPGRRRPDHRHQRQHARQPRARHLRGGRAPASSRPPTSRSTAARPRTSRRRPSCCAPAPSRSSFARAPSPPTRSRRRSPAATSVPSASSARALTHATPCAGLPRRPGTVAVQSRHSTARRPRGLTSCASSSAAITPDSTRSSASRSTSPRQGHDVTDVGTANGEESVDYPDFAIACGAHGGRRRGRLRRARVRHRHRHGDRRQQGRTACARPT